MSDVLSKKIEVAGDLVGVTNGKYDGLGLTIASYISCAFSAKTMVIRHPDLESSLVCFTGVHHTTGNIQY